MLSSSTIFDSPLALLLGLVLVVIGTGLSLYLVVVLASAFVGSFGGFFERAAFRRYSARCVQGDAFFAKGECAEAVQMFGGAFFLRPVRRDATLVSEVADYHTGLLNRLLMVADEMGKGRARLPSLAAADRLLAERLEIQLEYFRLMSEGDAAQAHAGDQRLLANTQQMRTALERLIDEVHSSEEKVLYH
jgi:hypothetical protein